MSTFHYLCKAGKGPCLSVEFGQPRARIPGRDRAVHVPFMWSREAPCSQLCSRLFHEYKPVSPALCASSKECPPRASTQSDQTTTFLQLTFFPAEILVETSGCFTRLALVRASLTEDVFPSARFLRFSRSIGDPPLLARVTWHAATFLFPPSSLFARNGASAALVRRAFHVDATRMADPTCRRLDEGTLPPKRHNYQTRTMEEGVTTRRSSGLGGFGSQLCGP